MKPGWAFGVLAGLGSSHRGRRDGVVAIYRLLQSTVFGPEEIARMAAAYEHALAALGLTDRSDPVTELLAKKIIEVARTGEADSARISKLAIKALGARPEN
jgi:hypothetical protein